MVAMTAMGMKTMIKRSKRKRMIVKKRSRGRKKMVEAPRAILWRVMINMVVGYPDVLSRTIGCAFE